MAPSNSTRSSGPAKASTTKAHATHHSVSTTAVGNVTVLGNGVSLERVAQCLGVHTSDLMHFSEVLRCPLTAVIGGKAKVRRTSSNCQRTLNGHPNWSAEVAELKISAHSMQE